MAERANSSAGSTRHRDAQREAELALWLSFDPEPAPIPCDLEAREMLARLGISVSVDEETLLSRYLGMLFVTNERINLTRIDRESAWRRHVVDSLTLLAPLASIDVVERERRPRPVPPGRRRARDRYRFRWRFTGDPIGNRSQRHPLDTRRGDGKEGAISRVGLEATWTDQYHRRQCTRRAIGAHRAPRAFRCRHITRCRRAWRSRDGIHSLSEGWWTDDGDQG